MDDEDPPVIDTDVSDVAEVPLKELLENPELEGPVQRIIRELGEPGENYSAHSSSM